MHKYIQAIRIGVIAVLLCAGIISHAQTITASVNGTVTDPSGAVVANAKVTATNVDTGVATPTTTNKDGIYNIPFLQIGQYKVTVEAPGFATATYGPFTLETGQNAKIDSKLGIAGQTQQVEVAAEVAPLLNTENAQLGDDARYARDREHPDGWPRHRAIDDVPSRRRQHQPRRFCRQLGDRITAVIRSPSMATASSRTTICSTASISTRL